MHARNLVELAARLVLESADPPGPVETTFELAKQYWTASKCRLESWQRSLKVFFDDLRESDPWHNPWPATEAVVEEILVSELLTRVWSAVLLRRDQAMQVHEFSAVAQSVFVSHLEISSRALRLLLAQPESRQADVEKINALRRRIESWTDLILAQLPEEAIAQRFAHRPDRLLEFAADRRMRSPDENLRSNQILIASLNSDLQKNTARWSANPELNRQIAAGVMAFLPAMQFDSIGLPKTPSQYRIEKTLDESDAYLEEFRQLCEKPESLTKGPSRWRGMLRSPFRRS